MKQITLCLAFHNHQPVGNFPWVFEAAYRASYLPMVECLERHPPVRVSLHYTGPLFDWLAANRPEFLDRLAELVRRGQVEMMTGGYYEPILPAIPEADRLGQIRKMTDFAMKNLWKEFDYLEWEYYLALISGKHKPPYESSTARAKEDVKRQKEFRDWSWVDKKNPLLGEKSEVEWLLNALTEVLERELKTASRDYHSPDEVEPEVEGGAGDVPEDRGAEGLESGSAREE